MVVVESFFVVMLAADAFLVATVVVDSFLVSDGGGDSGRHGCGDDGGGLIFGQR